MTVNFFSEEPDDFLADDFFEDGLSDDGFDDDPVENDGLTVDFAFNHDGTRLVCIYTSGLWQLGLPELYLRPPRNLRIGHLAADAQLTLFLATGLIELGYRLLESEGFDVLPYRTDLNGRQVRFWLGAQEPPFERLARNLDPGVDTVIQVHCSLGHAPLLGS